MKCTLWMSSAMLFITRFGLLLITLQFVARSACYYDLLRFARNKHKYTLNNIQQQFFG